jgi:hypothetical protein
MRKKVHPAKRSPIEDVEANIEVSKDKIFLPAQMYTLDSYETNAPHLCFFTKNPLMLHH